MPMELVQNFSTIEFAVAENPHGDGQTKKIPPQKRFGFSEFSLDIFKMFYQHYFYLITTLVICNEVENDQVRW